MTWIETDKNIDNSISVCVYTVGCHGDNTETRMTSSIAERRGGGSAINCDKSSIVAPARGMMVGRCQ